MENLRNYMENLRNWMENLRNCMENLTGCIGMHCLAISIVKFACPLNIFNYTPLWSKHHFPAHGVCQFSGWGWTKTAPCRLWKLEALNFQLWPSDLTYCFLYLTWILIHITTSTHHHPHQQQHHQHHRHHRHHQHHHHHRAHPHPHPHPLLMVIIVILMLSVPHSASEAVSYHNLCVIC
jgi:hypothetical protein